MNGRGFWKTAVRAAINAAGGIEAVGAALGYSKSHVGRWNNIHDGDLPDRDQILMLDELAVANGGGAPIAKAMARRVDHIAIPLPDASGCADRVTLQLHSATARFGAIAQVLVEALADGRIDACEEGAIAARVDETLEALVHLRALVIEDKPGARPVRAV